MLRSDTAIEPSIDCILNAVWPAFVRQPGLLARHHLSGQLHRLLESDIHPLKPQRACRPGSTEDRCPALAHWRTDQSA